MQRFLWWKYCSYFSDSNISHNLRCKDFTDENIVHISQMQRFQRFLIFWDAKISSMKIFLIFLRCKHFSSFEIQIFLIFLRWKDFSCRIFEQCLQFIIFTLRKSICKEDICVFSPVFRSAIFSISFIEFCIDNDELFSEFRRIF